jgi:hypothetical protein
MPRVRKADLTMRGISRARLRNGDLTMKRKNRAIRRLPALMARD